MIQIEASVILMTSEAFNDTLSDFFAYAGSEPRTETDWLLLLEEWAAKRINKVED